MGKPSSESKNVDVNGTKPSTSTSDSKKKPAAKAPVKKKSTKAKEVRIKVDKTLLNDNPELSDQGIEIGETIVIEKDAIVNAEELAATEMPEKPAKAAKKKLDPVLKAHFERLAVIRPHSKSSLIDLANDIFKGDAKFHGTSNPREVFFMVYGEKIPENGYFCINIV